MSPTTAESLRPTLDPTLAAQLLQVLMRFDDVRLAIVFGSAAAGRLRPDSDLDIAVKLGHAIGVQEKIDMVEALAERTGRPIYLVDLYNPPEPLLGQIIQHGYRLMGSTTEFAQLVSWHLIEQADFMPLVNRINKERREAWIGKSDALQKKIA